MRIWQDRRVDVADYGRLLGETPEVQRLREQSHEVRRLVLELAEKGPGGTDEVRPVVGPGSLIEELRYLEPLAVKNMRVLQPVYAYDPEDPGVQLVRRAEARGVKQRLITSAQSVRTQPLLTSIFPTTRIGPVF